MEHFRSIPSLFFLSFILLFFIGCERAPKDTTAEDRQAIEAINKQLMEAVKGGDAAAAAALYAEEPKLLPANSPMIVDREGIQAFFQGSIDAGVRDFQITTLELDVTGDMAYEVGKYTLTVQPEEVEAISDTGKYVVIWKREEGTWKLTTDIWNSSLPLPELPEPSELPGLPE